jgi:hypothetical protein
MTCSRVSPAGSSVQSKSASKRSRVVVTLPTWFSGRPLSRFTRTTERRSGWAAIAQKLPKL